MVLGGLILIDSHTLEYRGLTALALTIMAIATLVQGSQLTISTNPTNGALEFNLPFYQILRPGDTSLPWPQLTQAEISGQPANAPVS
jgi:hypothetical protein